MAMVSHDDGCRTSRTNLLHRDSATHARPGTCCRTNQQLLHGGMVKRNAGKLLWCGSRHGAMRRQNIPRIEIHPGQFVRAAAAQQFEYVHLDGFGDAPGEYAFAAHAIFELLLSLKSEEHT